MVPANGNGAILPSPLYFLLDPAKALGRFDHRLPLNQSSSAYRLRRAGAKNPAILADSWSGAGRDHLCAAPGQCGKGSLDCEA